MANRITRHKIRQSMRKQMVKWGMHEDEIALCLVEVKQRQALKERGDLPRDAPLCTRPAFRIYRQEFEKPSLSVGVQDLIDEVFSLMEVE